METKYIKIPFDAEKAKKIQSGEIEGRIVTRNGRKARIICWDAKRDDSIVALVEDDKGVESIISYISTGNFYIGENTDIDLILEIPEYMPFKDGDVIAFGLLHSITIGIFNKNTENNSHECYVVLNTLNHIYFDENGLTYENARIATEEEKQRLFDALKKNDDPRAKEYLKRFFPNYSNSSNIGKDCEFKPFDKVLVRDEDNKKWVPAFFWTKNDEFIVIGGSRWNQCIPYQGNEHLLGTTESPQ